MTTINYTECGAINDSTAINYYWYDGETKSFYVKFPGGSVAGYKDVPESTVQAFINASSRGKYYSTYIKGRYYGLNSDGTFVKRPLKKVSAATIAAAPISNTATMPPVLSWRITGVASVTETVPGQTLEQAIENFKKLFVTGVEVTVSKAEVSLG